MADVRAIVKAVKGVSRVNSNRKNDAPGTGKITASVLYAGEDLSEIVINSSSQRIEHIMPVAIEVRTTSAADDDLVDAAYDILDAVLLPANKPTDVIKVSPESISEPEGSEFLFCRVNVTIQFRRS